MNVLRRVHRTLVPGGLLLDMHPVPPSARAESRGVDLGAFSDREFFATVRATEAGLDQTVREGLFAAETELEFNFLERFETAEELLEAVADWQGCTVPSRLRGRIRSAAPPIDIRERVVLRRLRAL